MSDGPYIALRLAVVLPAIFILGYLGALAVLPAIGAVLGGLLGLWPFLLGGLALLVAFVLFAAWSS